MPSLVLASSIWYYKHRRLLLLAGSVLISVVALICLTAAPARADSPFNDPAYTRPHGGGSGGTTPGQGARPATLPPIPAGYTELTPPLLSVAQSRSGAVTARPALQQQGPDTNPNNPLAWMGLSLNPGKWLLDSVLGATTGIIYSLASIFEVLGRFGNGQVVDINGTISSVSDSAFGFLFTTPENLTIAWSGANGLGSPEAMHNVMRQVALSILVIICTYRAVFVLTGNNFRGDLIDLLIAFVGGVAGIQGAWWFCSLFVRAANLITQTILQNAFGAGLNNWIPLDPATYFWSNLGGQGASLAVSLVTLVYWAILALLALHAIARIVMVNLMLIVSPLAGLAIVSGSGWNYARVWFFRLVELLATPLVWGATLGFARSLMSGFGVDTQPILGPILAIFAMCLVFRAPKLLGFAAQEAVSGVRSVVRMAERAAFALVMAGSAAAGAAAGAAAATTAEKTPTIYVDLRGAEVSGSGGNDWDGPSFGAPAARPALPPRALPPPSASTNIVDQE